MSISVELTNFRCHPRGKWTFPLGITHLRGESGSGKTTILHAIRWCLYDCERKVHPKRKKSARTSVTVVYSGKDTETRVTRTTHPKRLTLTQRETTWEGDEAQTRVNHYFGTEGLWHVTSYYPQFSYHPFLAHGATEATRAFYSLVDASDDPKAKIDLINRKVEELSTERASLLQRLRGRTCDHERCPPVPSKDPATLLVDLQRMMTRVKECERTLVAAKASLEYLSLPSTYSLSALESELHRARQSQALHKRREDLIRQALPLPLSLKVDEVEREIKLIEKRKKNQEACEEVPYDSTAIKTILDDMEKRMRASKESKSRREAREAIEKRMKVLRCSIITHRPSREVEDALHAIEVRLRCSVGDPCPKCGTLLSQGKGGWVEGELDREERTRLESERSSLRDELSKARESESREEQLRQCENELVSLSELPIVEWSDEDSSHYYRLKSVEMVSESIYCLEDLAEQRRLLPIHKELNSLAIAGRSIDEIESDITIEKKRTSLKSLIPSHALPTVEDAEGQLNVAIEESETLSSLIAEVQREHDTYLPHKECDEVRMLESDCTRLSQRLTFLSTCLSMAQSLYSSDVQDALQSINTSLLVMTPRLYSEDVTIALSNDRTGLKGKSVVEVVAYEDSEEGDINSTSVGERTRASIAILLACYLYRPSLFIVLDEPLHSVGAKWDEVIMELIKEVVTTTPCIIMSHGDLGQHVNQVVEVTKVK